MGSWRAEGRRDWRTGELMDGEWYMAAISYLDGSGNSGRADSFVFQVLCVCVCVCFVVCSVIHRYDIVSIRLGKTKKKKKRNASSGMSCTVSSNTFQCFTCPDSGPMVLCFTCDANMACSVLPLVSNKTLCVE